MSGKMKIAVGDKEVSALPSSSRLRTQTDRLPTTTVWIPVESNEKKKEVGSQDRLNQLFGQVLGEWEKSKGEKISFQAVQFSRGRQVDSLPKPQAAKAFQNGIKRGEICVAIYQGYSGPAYTVSHFRPGRKEGKKTVGEVILILFPANFVTKVTQLYQKPIIQQAITDALRLDLETTAKGIKRHQLAPHPDPNQIVQIFSF